MAPFIAEFIGTFFLVLIIGLTGNPIAIGCGLVCLVYMGGPVSGAHYNPAVTLAVFMRKKIKWKEALLYVAFQMAGSMLGTAICFFVSGKVFYLSPQPGYSILQALMIEFLFTFLLVTVILYVAGYSKTAGNSYYGLAIGFTVLAAAYAGGGISGGAYNPAVGIGPALMELIIGEGTAPGYAWLYAAGPFSGSVAAAVLFKMLNLKE